MAKTWSKELGQKYNATVNCVAPGPVETNTWNAVDEEFRNAIGVEKHDFPVLIVFIADNSLSQHSCRCTHRVVWRYLGGRWFPC